MFEYSIFEKSNDYNFSMNNQVAAQVKNKNKKQNNNNIKFKINTLKKNLPLIVDKDISLEDLYAKIYNVVYPDFSSEKNQDFIPPAATSIYHDNFPKLYNVAVINDENVMTIPFHRFITISSFMKSKPEFFENVAMFGSPIYKIYVLDETTLAEFKKVGLKKLESQKNESKQDGTFFQKLLQCASSSKTL